MIVRLLSRYADTRLRAERDRYRALAHDLAARLKEARAETQEVATELAAERARTQEIHQ